MATLLEYQEYLDELNSRAQLREDDERRGLRLDAAERRSLLLDVPLSVGRGIIGAVHEAAEGLGEVDAWLNDKLDMGAIVFGANASNGVIGFASGQQDFNSIFDLTSEGFGAVNEFVPETETGTGAFIEGLSRWVAGFYTGGKVIKAATAAPKAFASAAGIVTNIGKMRTVAAIVRTMRWTGKGALAGAFADFFTTNIEHGNLSNLVEGTIVENPVSRFLAIDEDDSELEARLKTVAEGGIAGVAIEGVLRGGRALLSVRRLAQIKQRDIKLEAERKTKTIREEEEFTSRLSDDRPPEDFRSEDLTAEDFGFQTDEARGFVAETTVVDTNYSIRTNKEGRTIVTALSRGKGNNHLVLQTTDDVVQVVEVYVDKGSRNQGIGSSLYEVAIDHVLKSGKRFVSDATLLEPGYRRWVALKEKGYGVVENTDVNIQSPTGNEFRGRTTTRDGSPVFEITSRPDGAGPANNLKIVPKDITASTTDARQIADTLVTHIENAGMTVDEIVTALKETGSLASILGPLRGSVNRRGGVNFKTVDWNSFGDQNGDMQKIIALTGDAWDKVLENESATTMAEILRRATKITTDSVMGDTGVVLLADLRKDGGLAGRVLATQQLLLESAQRVTRLAREIVDGNASDGIRREMFQQNLMHRHLYAVARGASHEVALTMRSMQILKKSDHASAEAYLDILKDLRIDPNNVDLLERLAKMGDAGAVSQELKRTIGQKAWSVTLEVLYGNLLSSPATLTANFFGNLYKLARSFTDPLAGMAVSSARRRVAGRVADVANLIDLQAHWFGMWAGLHDSLYFSIRIIRQGLEETGGVRALLHKPGRTQLTEYLVERKAIGTLYEAVATGSPVTSASGRGIPRERSISMEGKLELPSVEDFHNKAMSGLLATSAREGLKAGGRGLVNRAGNAIRFFPGSIMAIDEIFKTIAYRQSIYADAFRLAEAMRRLPEAGTVPKREVFIAESMRDIEAQATAVEFAQSQTFQQRGGKFMQSVETLVNATPGLRIILPFIRTPGNLFKEAFTTLGGPLQLLMRDNRAILKAGWKSTATTVTRARSDKLMGQAIIATTITGTVIMWALDGRIVGRRGGSGALDGVAPNSIRFGDKWFTYNRLDPLGMVVGLIGEFVEGTQDGIEADEEIWSTMLKASMTAIMHNAASKTWLQGLSDLVLMMDDNDRYADAWLSSVGANLIPFLGSSYRRRQVATADPYARQVFDWIDSLKARGVIGNRQDLGIRRDSLGIPIKDESTMSGIIRVTEETTDPLRLALVELDYALPMPSKLVKEVALTGQQYSRLLELRGQTEMGGAVTMELALRRLVLSDEFARQYDEAKIEFIRVLVGRYTRLAKSVLESEDEVLHNKIIVELINKRNLLAIQ